MKRNGGVKWRKDRCYCVRVQVGKTMSKLVEPVYLQQFRKMCSKLDCQVQVGRTCVFTSVSLILDFFARPEA